MKLKEYQERYSPENVLLFGRSVLYRFIKIFFPLLTIFVVNVSCLVLLYIWLDWSYFIYFLIVFLLFDLVLIVPVITKYFDYKMDFIIVTPDHLIMYDQKWILDKNVITINEKSIKTIFVKRPGFLYSVFNNWDIIFLSEWDTNYGEITLRRVAKPEKRKWDIARIMWKDIKRIIVEDNSLDKYRVNECENNQSNHSQSTDW